MQVTLHATRPTPHGASRLLRRVSAWSVKLRRSPFRPCRDASVCGHSTASTHDNMYTISTPPPYMRCRMLKGSCSKAPCSRLVVDDRRSVHETREHVKRCSVSVRCLSTPYSRCGAFLHWVFQLARPSRVYMSLLYPMVCVRC